MNKKIGILILFIMFVFSSSNLINATSEKTFIKEYKTEKEINNIEKNISIDNINYNLKDITLISNGNEKIERDEKQTISITTNTDNKDEIFKLFENSIEYSKDDFKGNLTIDKSSLKVELTNDGIYKELVEINKNYDNLQEADLSLIPKTINSNNIEYYLTTCIWETSKEEKIDDINTIPTEYKAKCIYKAIINKQGTKTYKCTVDYVGKVYKDTKGTYKYKVTYISNEEVPQKENNLLEYATTTTLIIVVFLIYISNKNATLFYVDKNGNKEKIKKVYISKKHPLLNLTKIKDKTNHDKYILELKENLYNKIKGKNIIIKNGEFSFEKNINSKNISF